MNNIKSLNNPHHPNCSIFYSSNICNCEEQKKGFKGVFVLQKNIKKYGRNYASLIAGYVQGAPLPNLSKNQIRKIRKLIGIKTLSPTQIKDYIINNKGNETCEWCDSKCHILHSHHYPISKKDKGKDKVKICGKCHSDYHYIQNWNIGGIK